MSGISNTIKRRIFLCALAGTLPLAGCTTTPNAPNSNGSFGFTSSMLTTPYSMVPGINPVILGVTTAAAINTLLPSWSLDDMPIGGDKYRIFLKKKTFSSGGDGEAAQLFKYRAEQIAATKGYNGYQILEFTEGLDSGVLGTQRVAQGIIQCQKSPTASEKK
ncbi:MAG: hypothetical protein AB7U30_04555 [Sulfuricellaceae bacterium]|jgi:hypothetical protein